MPLSINQTAVLALAISREIPNALDHHIASAIETVSSLYDDVYRQYGVDYDFDTALDRACDFVQDEIDGEAAREDEDRVDTSYVEFADGTVGRI